MNTAVHILVALIALLHVWFVLLETVLFESRGRRVFGLTADKAAILKQAMSNQGCYNGFLVAALALGLFHPEAAVAHAFTVYGLACVVVAGLWGGATVSRRILFVQAAPAAVTLALLFAA